jgi:hypothetical protein
MESHLSRKYTLSDLEPGWPEDLGTSRVKSSPRMHGSLIMSLRRVSRNPENSRPYVHGDPIQLIDWKAYARTDELIVREHRDEAAAKISIVIDQSESLKWPMREALLEHGGIGSTPQKIEIACRVALYLAHAHVTMGDMVTIAFLDGDGGVTRCWTPRSPADLLGMYELSLKIGFIDALESLMAISNWSASSFDCAWWLSDFLKDHSMPSIWSELKRVAVLHVFSHLELSTDWMDGSTSYRDETRGRKIYLGDQLKSGHDWQDAIESWRTKVKSVARRRGGAYLAIDDTTNVGDFFHWLTTEAI